MRTLLRGIVWAVAVAGAAVAAEPDAGRVKKLFVSDDYTVTWGVARDFDAAAELEVGDGNGHGGWLAWLRFRPGKDGVDVLCVELELGRVPYESPWPPDRAPVAVKLARMKPDAYAALLRDLAVVDAAKLKRVERNSFSVSTKDVWVSARLVTARQTLLDLDWAGNEGSLGAVAYARPRAAVTLAREAVEKLDWQDHKLTAEERTWAGARFARDWKKFKGLDSYWWVRERSIILIGVVGDAAALPTLRDLLGGDPKDRVGKSSEDRCLYHAINAVTRLTGQDVRDRPVEEMDVEKARRRVLELLKDVK